MNPTDETVVEPLIEQEVLDSFRHLPTEAAKLRALGVEFDENS